jgi:translation elongation factor EF-Tu-like GTPase
MDWQKQVERGTALKGTDVEILGMGDSIRTTLTGIEMFHKELDRVCSALDFPVNARW